MRTDDVCNACVPLIRSISPSDMLEDALLQFKTIIHDQLYSKKERHGASIMFIVEGKPYKMACSALMAIEPTTNFDVVLLGHDLSAPWDYDLPTKRIEVHPGGLGFIYHTTYDAYETKRWDEHKFLKTKCMLRAYVTRALKPKKKGVIAEDQVLTFKREFIPVLTTPQEVFRDAVNRGVIPTEIRIIAYTKKGRHAYRLDLASDTLLLDVRAGKFPIHAFRVREPVLYPMFDKVLVSLDVPDITRNMFEMIFESDRLNINDLCASLGITRLTATNNLAALVTRGLVETESVKHDTIYYVNLSAITGVNLDEPSADDDSRACKG